MNIGINQSFLSHAFAVSVVLHGVALALLPNTFLTNPNNTLQVIRPDTPTLKAIEVELKSLPSQAFDTGQTLKSSPEKQATLRQPDPRKSMTEKPVKLEHQKKVAALVKPSSQHKKTESAKKQTVKALNRQAMKMPDILLTKASNQAFETHKNLTASDKPNPLIANAKTHSKEPPLIEGKANFNNKLDAFSKQSSSSGQLVKAKLTNRSTGISSSLPPFLKFKQPEFPEEARWEERTGKATLKFKISDQGRVTEQQVTKSSGHRDLDMAAIQAIQFWRFKAKESHAANQWYQYSFRFELN